MPNYFNFIRFANTLKRGFTLIELLVVMAILGILISIITLNFTTAQKQARDARRKEDISSIQSALEQYYAINGSYPAAGSLADAFESGTVPEDPKNEGAYTYIWNYDQSTYCVCAVLERQSGNATAPSSNSCNWTTGASATHLCAQNQQ